MDPSPAENGPFAPMLQPFAKLVPSYAQNFHQEQPLDLQTRTDSTSESWGSSHSIMDFMKKGFGLRLRSGKRLGLHRLPGSGEAQSDASDTESGDQETPKLAPPVEEDTGKSESTVTKSTEPCSEHLNSKANSEDGPVDLAHADDERSTSGETAPAEAERLGSGVDKEEALDGQGDLWDFSRRTGHRRRAQEYVEWQRPGSIEQPPLSGKKRSSLEAALEVDRFDLSGRKSPRCSTDSELVRRRTQRFERALHSDFLNPELEQRSRVFAGDE